MVDSMSFNNIGKRDILILVKFNNIEKIKNIQSKYYDLYGKVEPHIAITFPFESNISDEELYTKLNDILCNYEPFKIICHGISTPLVDSNYRFLNIVENKDIIKNISDNIYNNIIPEELEYRDRYNYNPHITLSNKPLYSELILNDYFEMIVDSIYVEKIGINDESIKLYDIYLGKQNIKTRNF